MKKTMILLSALSIVTVSNADTTGVLSVQDSAQIHNIFNMGVKLGVETAKANGASDLVIGGITILTLILGMGLGRLIHNFVKKETIKKLKD